MTTPSVPVRRRNALAAAILVWALAGWGLSAALPPGWLGVAVNDASHETGADASHDAGAGAGGETGAGARLVTVLPESPAMRGGLAVGDLVLEAGGQQIRAARDLTRAVKAHRPGSVLPLTVQRGEAELVLEATLAARPPDAYRLFESERDAWQEPERVLDLLELRPDATIADLGAGSGYFTERLAARVGPGGQVVAIEIDADALTNLAGRFGGSAFPQVVIKRGSERDPRLTPASLDLALMVDTYHELTDAPAILNALRHALRPGGRLAIIDRPAATDAAGTHAIAETRVIAETSTAGFELHARHDLPRQFLLLFVKRAVNSR